MTRFLLPKFRWKSARLSHLFAALFFAILVCPCCAQTRSPAPGLPAAAAPPSTQALRLREVTDEYGRTVRLPQAPERIVSLAPSLTETIYALGAQDRLVGDTDYCDYPPDAQKKPKVGGIKNPNLEQIVALHPDLVLLTKEINRIETLQALDTLGIPAYATTDAHNIEDIIASTQRLAELLGAQETGKAVSAEMETRLNALQSRLQAAEPSRVLFVVWTEPLISVGKNTFIADALRRAGAASVVDTTNDWPQVSLEEVVRLQPEYLIFAESQKETGVRDLDALAERPGWRLLNAVRNKRFAVISDAVNRPAPRIVSAIEELARQLHPAAFAEPALPEKPGASAPASQGGPPPLALGEPHFDLVAGNLGMPPVPEHACAR